MVLVILYLIQSKIPILTGIGQWKDVKAQLKTSGGFIWKYKEDQNLIEEINLDHKHNKPVNQYDLDSNVINNFKSKTEAEQKLGIKSLYYALKSNKPINGFIFRYVSI